mgnify:CR=1 FL=1
MDNVSERLLNPTVILTMLLTGVAYGWFLWALHIRPRINLWATAVFPGVMFLATIWAIRAAQGVAALTYVALMVDWLIFSVTGVLTVLAARRWKGRRDA